MTKNARFLNGETIGWEQICKHSVMNGVFLWVAGQAKIYIPWRHLFAEGTNLVSSFLRRYEEKRLFLLKPSHVWWNFRSSARSFQEPNRNVRCGGFCCCVRKTACRCDSMERMGTRTIYRPMTCFRKLSYIVQIQ